MRFYAMNQSVELHLEELRRLAAFLQKHVGIALEDEKLLRLKRKIEAVMQEEGIKNFNQLYHRIRFAKDEALLQKIVNAVTINETYFWREYEQFEILVRDVLPKIVQKNKQAPHIRILSLPSSSGEELYSIMMAIVEQKELFDRANFEMVGVDLDSVMIAKAKAGIYAERSLMRLPKALKDRYFQKVGNRYVIDQKFRHFAKFLQGNLFDSEFIDKLGKFDIIFCRNMLIYFNQEDKKRAFMILYELLKEGGYLFLGHADANGIDKAKFQPIAKGFHVYQKM